MSLPLKVLWVEGVSIRPHQLQQQDRYHEARVQRMASAIHPDPWGVRAVRWNLDGLKNNSLEAEALSLIFQDGEIYDAPGADALPVKVDLGKLPISEQSFTLYAALPALKAHGGNLSDPDAPRDEHGARYAQVASEAQDLFGAAASLEVLQLRKTVRLLSHLEARDGYDSFPLVRVRRLASGAFELDPDFMPPSLSLAADAALPRLLERLLEQLSAKIEALYSRQRQSSRGAIEVHGGDSAAFWMLNTLSGACASLSHCASYRRHHPEQLFDKLMALAGALLTFSRKYTLADLPAYRHEDSWPAFARLDAIIRDLAETVISSRYFTIPLEIDEERSTHSRALLDAAQFDQHTMLYVAVNADMPALELVGVVPLRFKIAAPDDITVLIGRALPGVRLVHMAQVPVEVPVRPNTYYFSLENKGALYEKMIAARALTIYVPSGIDGLKLELFGIAA